MRYDFEIAGAQIVADYLSEVLDASITNICPVVTFFDPMSVQDAHRIVVMVPNGSTDSAQPGSAEMLVEVGVRSRYRQTIIQQDFADHFERLNAVRSALFVENLAAVLDIGSPAGIGICHATNKKDFQTNIYGEGWIYSQTSFRITLFAKHTTP